TLPKAPYPRRQAGPRRARPRGEDHRSRPSRRRVRGHLHGPAPDSGDDRRHRRAGGRGRHRTLHHVGRPHDALSRGHRPPQAGGGERRGRFWRRHHPRLGHCAAQEDGRRGDLHPGRHYPRDRRVGAEQRPAAAMTMQPSRVTIYEVGPRDGLQNESARLPVDAKVRLVEALAAAGLSRIEVGSFVRADWIPQLADTEEVARRALRIPRVQLSALVPNRHGLERAIASGMREVAVFMSSSEAHNQKNTNKPIARSLELFGEIVPEALRNGLTVRAYLSTVWGCPYEGAVDPMRSFQLARQLRDMGCREISLGDTIGVGNPLQTRRLLELFLGGKGSLGPLARDEVALHLHDTNGTALANALVGLEMGITTFDTAIGGLGGCPYAPGAAGNLATEDLAGMLSDMGIETGIDLDKLVDAGLLAQQVIGRKLPGRRLQAALGRRVGGEARPAAST